MANARTLPQPLRAGSAAATKGLLAARDLDSAGAGASPRDTAGSALSMLAVHALDEGDQASVHALPHVLTAVHTSGADSRARPVSPAKTHITSFAASAEAADFGSPRMRRSLEDSASLLLLAGVRATDALETPSEPVTSLDGGGAPALGPAHTQPAPGRAVAVHACEMGHCPGCNSRQPNTESAEDSKSSSASLASSGGAAKGTPGLHATDGDMLAGRHLDSPAQTWRCPGADVDRRVRLQVLPCSCLVELRSDAEPAPALCRRISARLTGIMRGNMSNMTPMVGRVRREHSCTRTGGPVFSV